MVVCPGHEAESDVIQSWMGKPAHIKCLYFSTLVSGDANFQMKHTALSVGGFIQPSVAKASVGKHHIKMYVKSNVLLGCMAKPVMA